MMRVVTADEPKAGTDCNVTVKVFGSKGSSRDIEVEKIDDRFDRDKTDDIKVFNLKLNTKLCF